MGSCKLLNRHFSTPMKLQCDMNSSAPIFKTTIVLKEKWIYFLNVLKVIIYVKFTNLQWYTTTYTSVIVLQVLHPQEGNLKFSKPRRSSLKYLHRGKKCQFGTWVIVRLLRRGHWPVSRCRLLQSTRHQRNQRLPICPAAGNNQICLPLAREAACQLVRWSVSCTSSRVFILFVCNSFKNKQAIW